MSHSVIDSPTPLGKRCPKPEQARDTLSDIRQVVITNIRATDLTLGLRRIPAGFYVKVLADNVQWQTTNKPIHIDLDVLEWNERIVLPSEESCKIRFSIYASFELGPMLGHGYLLRTFKISVAELLNRSQNSRPIAFQPEKGEVLSPCTSLSISAKHVLAGETDVDVLRPIVPSTCYNTSELTLKTDVGHIVLARYCRTRDNRDLDQSIAYFERSRDLCMVDHPCCSAALVNLATAKFIICQVQENYHDLDLAIVISLFQDALNLRPTGHPDRPATQLNLAIALLSRFTKRGFHMDADSAKELLNEVLDVCHAESSIYRSALLAIETSVLLPAKNADPNDIWVERLIASVLPLSVNEFNRRAKLCLQSDDHHALDEVISLHCDGLKYYSTIHHYRCVLLFNLGAMLGTRFLRRGNDKDLDEAIAFLREAPTLRPVGHPDRNSSLDRLATLLSLRFQHRGDDEDLNEAIRLQKKVQSLRPVDHPDRGSSLNNLASMLWTRFQHRGDDKDLDQAIRLQRKVQTLQLVGHPDQDSSLNNLANALSTRFKHRGDNKDLDETIKLQRKVQTLRPVGHPDRGLSLNNLASTLWTRFQHQGDDKDLDEAITLHREALTLRPVGHPDRDLSLNNLGSALSTRFKHRGGDKDLDQAIRLHREAHTLRPAGHPCRESSLNNLANVLSTRFQRRGDDKDLDEAITLLRETQTLQPVGHPHRDSLLNDLANVLWTRFERRGDDKDLDEAITLHREAQTLWPAGHPYRDSSLHNLASALLTRFERRGDDLDLDEAITLHREAHTLRPVGHPYRSSSLNGLASVLSTRFEHRGDDKDLNEAIVLHREAQTLWPVGHPHRDSSLYNLASVLWARFGHQGDDKDLDEAIALLREAQTLQPVGHPCQYLLLNGLASVLSTRFEHRADDKDLNEAIALHREAQTLRPVDHPHRDLPLHNLATALWTRFQHQGDDKDLDEAITLHREAQTLQPVGHPLRRSTLNSLSNELSTRFNHRGNCRDLDEAITLRREVLTLWPVGHPYRPMALANLSTALSMRFDHRGNDKDLDNALAIARSALTQLTKHHPHHLQVNNSLATIYLSLHQLGLNGTSNDIDYLNTAIHHLKAAVDSISGGLLHRLRASLTWVRTADQYTHRTLLEAYTTSIQLLDAYISVTASVSSRHHAMKAFPATLAVDAASCALQCGDVCRAVEVLEQGRTLIWTQMARFRTSFDSLLERGDHAQALVKKFREVSSLLDKPPAQLPEGTPILKIEAEATQYSRLVDDWNSTVQEIRMVEGFSRFMLPPLFSDLQDAARDGPVVILIASKSFCDAIIIRYQHSPIRVQLPTSLERLQCLVITLQQTVQLDPHGKQTRVNETAEAEPEVVPQQKQTRLVEVLRELWDDVVCHVVERLDGFARPGSRIWWCPTFVFNFLPLHAAGEYRPGRKNLSHSYVSSYTPSLTALIRARRNRDESLPITFAAIGQNHPQGFKHPLSSVEPELDLVQSLLPPSSIVSFAKVTSVESTKSSALHTLRDNHWLHFACHGKHNFAEPFMSALIMRDQPLTLLDIMQTDLSRHQFAFLSACETAVGDTETDEVIHLAAGLQFAGVKSVIGTFWSVEDHTVRYLVKGFYKNFCEDGNMNSKRAARALHKAVRSLANNKDIALDQRIVFMHIGL